MSRQHQGRPHQGVNDDTEAEATDDHWAPPSAPPPPDGSPRSWRKRLEGGSKLASAQMKQSADRVKESVLLTGTGQRAAELSQEARGAVDDRLGAAAATPGGQRVGAANAKVGKALSRIPGLGVMGDAAAVQNGVDLLTAAVKADPTNPERQLHLALALQRTERDMAQYRLAKTLAKPQSLLSRTVLRKAMRFGRDDEPPLQEKLLRAAYKRCVAVKKARPADGDNLHLLGRIYLVQRQPDAARKLVRLALAASPTHPGDAYVTLAVVEELAGERARAARYAELAVEHGSTLGHQIRADHALAGGADADAPTLERIRRYEQWAARVDPAHEERYYGVALNQRSIDVARRLAGRQKDKATDLAVAVGDRVSRRRPADPDIPGRGPAPTAPEVESSPTSPAAASPPLGVLPAGWYVDPLGRHQHRYWDGERWSGHVSDDGVPASDPPRP